MSTPFAFKALTTRLSLLQLLLHSQVVGVPTLLLATILRTGMKSSVTFATDHLVAVVFLCKKSQTRFDDTTSQSQHEMKSRLLLNVVITQSATIFQLFAGKNQSLLVGWNAFFIMNLGFDIVDCITWFNLKG